MALAELSPAFKSLTGRVGNLVAVKHSDGKIVLRRRPTITREPTKNQLANRDRVRNAVLYGKKVLADAELGQVYREKGKELGKRAFNLAFRDFFHGPEVTEIDPSGCTGKKGEQIRVRATDDFGVASVHVQLDAASGNRLEGGAAALDASGQWIYTTQTEIPPDTRILVTATAQDRPENTGTKTQHWLTRPVGA